MWETFKTWFLANQDDILVPVVSGLILVFAIGLWKFFTKPQTQPLQQPEPPQPIVVPTTDAETAKELGVTEAALRNFFKILQEQHVGADELDAKLRDIAQQHKDLLERIAAIPDVDERTNTLRDDAEAAITDGRYAEADTILHDAESQDLQAAAELEDQLHIRKLAAATSAYARGELAVTRFKYQDAASHFLRAAEHTPYNEPRTQIKSFNMAGRAFSTAAEFPQAETAYAQALTAAEAQLGANDPLTATVLNNLAQLYKATNRMAQAEPLMERALATDEKAFGAEHRNVARDLNNLAMLYQDTNRMEQAEPLMERALAIDEKAFGAGHPNVAIRLNNLASLYQAASRMEQAEPLMGRALAIDEKAFGAEHPNVAIRLNNLAMLYQGPNRMTQAEPLLVRAVGIFTAALGAEHPNTLTVAGNLEILRQEMAARGD